MRSTRPRARRRLAAALGVLLAASCVSVAAVAWSVTEEPDEGEDVIATPRDVTRAATARVTAAPAGAASASRRSPVVRVGSRRAARIAAETGEAADVGACGRSADSVLPEAFEPTTEKRASAESLSAYVILCSETPPWLVRHQAPDGRWSSDFFCAQCSTERCDDPGVPGRDASATGLSLLTFLGAGETHQSGPHRDTVGKGLRYLRGVQDADGCFAVRSDPRFLTEHAIAALAMCEAYGMTGSRQLKAPAQRAIDFVLTSPGVHLPWRDGATDSDFAALPWLVLLLRSVRDTPIEVDDDVLPDLVRWLDDVTDRRTGHVEIPGAPASCRDLLTAAGLLARIFAGHTFDDDPRLWPAASELRDLVGADGRLVHPLDATTQLFVTSALFRVGLDPWDAWKAAVKAEVLDAQDRDRTTEQLGSWSAGVLDAAGGRVTVTALNLLTMEVYWRYPVVTVRGGERN